MSTQTLAEPAAAPPPAGPPARVVLKIGTSSLVNAGRLDPAKVATLARTVRRGIAAGLAPVLVTSGAIALGRTRHPALDAGTVAADTAQQVAFALGQGDLYGQLQAEFARHGLVTGHADGAELGKLKAFSGVSRYPLRVKCATLAWHALKSALVDAGL